MISKKLHCSIYFRLLKFTFFNFNLKILTLSMAVCLHPSHLGSSVIQYHLCASTLFICPISIKYSLLEYKRYIDIYITTKIWQNWKKKKKIQLLRTNMSVGEWNFKWIYFTTQNIWACLWNRHNSMNLILSFPCKSNPSRIPDHDSHSSAVLNLFLMALRYVLHWISMRILIILLFELPLTFLQTQKGIPLFITKLMTILVLIGLVFVIMWEMFHGMTSLNSMLLRLLLNSMSRSRLELMNLSLIVQASFIFIIFSFVCYCIAQRNRYFRLCLQNKSSVPKVKFRHVGNHCRRVLEAAKLA